MERRSDHHAKLGKFSPYYEIPTPRIQLPDRRVRVKMLDFNGLKELYDSA